MLTMAPPAGMRVSTRLVQVAQAQVVDLRQQRRIAVPGTPAMLHSASMRCGSWAMAASMLAAPAQVGL